MAPDGNIIERSALAQAAGRDATLRGLQGKRSSRLGLVTAIVLVVVVFSSIGLVFTQPWSKVKVIVTHNGGPIEVAVYIDGVLKASIDIPQGMTTVGAWSVSPGTHTVWVDEGSYMWGNPDFANTYDVGLLSTKNVYVTLD